MPSNSTVQTGNFHEISEDTGLYLSTNDALPPTLCPELIPFGWTFKLVDDEPEGWSFQAGDDYVEVYVLRRLEFNHDQL